ncbi:hypothetical protein HG536_0A03730 [Torulaspora globosa]|uniref:Phosphoglycerate mutase n=1 Tax=Torulaspora globosa TaxID=48254 RepID=A0A7G3ZAL9_9SACH|nr:uncharacterized protein HG536_0A03730 [Torulaspora globosa]QLL30555.1 hypothetical protein HG536_0A03730 [Torulaspora globosa]
MPFTALPGYFRAFESADSEGVDSRAVDHLELVAHDSWRDLHSQIPADTDTHHYKLVVLARHGQGYHNAALLRYGLEAWEDHWSFLVGDEYGDWLDSKLTALGKEQVEKTGLQVLAPMVGHIEALPDVFFTSPMRRCLETFIGSWGDIFRRNNEYLKDSTIPVQVVENLRERLGEHTCDKRVPHSEVVGEYQHYATDGGNVINWHYEPGYPEEDELWFEDYRETDAELDERLHTGLSQIFGQLNSDQRFISITCHSGVIQSILRNLSHPPVRNLDTGKVVCVVVKINVNRLKGASHL